MLSIAATVRLRTMQRRCSIGCVGINKVNRGDGPLYAAIFEAGFSIGGFARKMGVVRTTVWRIDRGLLTPTNEWWQRAALLLGVHSEDIMPRELAAA
jgi:hypothetical protein